MADPEDIGRRVRVYDGTGETLLGEGVYQGEVIVYFWPDGIGIKSLKQADVKPEGVPEEEIYEAESPKILLDDGRTVFGCQVWWNFIDKSPVPRPSDN